MDYYKPMQHLLKRNNNSETKSTFYVRLKNLETLGNKTKTQNGNNYTFTYEVTLDTRERPIYDFSDVNVVSYNAGATVQIKVLDRDGSTVLGHVTNNTDNCDT